MLSLPSRKSCLPGACNGIPTGTSGSCGEMKGTTTETTVTTRIKLTAAQLSTREGDFGSDRNRSRPRDQVPAVGVPAVTTAMSARLPFDAGHPVWTPGRALEPDVELPVTA